MLNNKMINSNKSQFFRSKSAFLFNFIHKKNVIHLLNSYHFNLLFTKFIEQKVKLFLKDTALHITFDF